MKTGDKWKEWTVGSLLGQGVYSKVFEIHRVESGHVDTAALKELSIPWDKEEIVKLKKEGVPSELIKEKCYEKLTEKLQKINWVASMRGQSGTVLIEDYSIAEKTGDIGWDVYIQMELLTPLNKVLIDRGMMSIDVIKLGTDICRALEQCNINNTAHGNINPEKIYISEDGRFKLGGLENSVKACREREDLGRCGARYYAAPEIVKGEPYSAAADIYSLGLILYSLLNNMRLPFMPPYPERIRIADKEKAMMSRMNGERMPYPQNADGKLGEIVLKACEYIPHNRFRSACEMRKALEEVKR
ncbi:MAG: protein kinase [Mogibacterium sp.]|nr:protein kinase [Mogibacterium sp.]